MKIIKNLTAEELRKSILQLAIQGKLVKQDPNDEPASELVKRIYAEKQKLIKEGKIKKEKNESFIFKGDDNCYYEKIGNQIKKIIVPFEIPPTWKWVKARMILSKIQYGYNGAGINNGIYKLLRITDIQNNSVDWNTLPYCNIETFLLDEYQIHKDDIFIARTGGTIGKSFLLSEEKDNTVFAGYLIRFQLINKEQSQYVAKYLTSQLYWRQVSYKSFGTGQPNINGISLGNLFIPIPPIDEQNKIIKKINSIDGLITN